MFGFYANDRVMIKDTGEKATIIRNFIGTTCYLVKSDNGKEFAVDRNEITKNYK